MKRTVVIPTKDRAKSLRRVIGRLLTLSKEASLPSIIIVDGGETAESRNKTKEELRAVETEHRFKLRYISVREVQSFVKALAAEGVEEETSLFALSGNLGAARNAGLIETSGEKVAFVDDDVIPTICRFGPPTTAVFRSKRMTEVESDTALYWTRRSKDEAIVDDRLLKRASLFYELFEYLGRRVEGVRAALRTEMLVKGEKTLGMVRATQLGAVGDLVGRPWGGYFRIKGLRTGTACGRVHVEETFHRGPFFLTHAFALDNTDFLPPFPSFEGPQGGLGGGSLYGSLLRLLPDSYTAYRPWAVYHDCPDRRDHVVAFSTRDACVEVLERSKNLEDLSKELILLGSLPENDFATWLKGCLTRHLARTSSEIRHRSSALGLQDLYDPKSVEISGADHRLQLRYFGQVLKAWADILAASKILKEKGIRISVEL